MPIIDIQRRLREVGRIRLGEQVPTSGGKKRPAKLTTFRLTSRDDMVLHAAAELWGGEVKPWDNDGTPEFELYTTTNQMPVVIPPTEMAFSQWYEQWSKGGCQVRCDGQWDQVGDKACHCDPEDRACKITTRLSVMLPDLPGLGVWRVESHGYYAAVELNGAVEVCQQFAGAGRMLPARLRLEPRTVVRTGRDGRAETRRFAVPVLDVDVTIGQLGIGGPGAGAAITAGGPPPAFQPVPELDAGPTLAEQLDAIDQPPQQAPRANGRAPLPATGVAPRPAAAVARDDGPVEAQVVTGVPSCGECGQSLAGHAFAIRPGGVKVHKDGCPDAGAPAPAPVEELPLDDPRDDFDRQRRRFHAIAAKRWPDTASREAMRHEWLRDNWDVASLNELTAQHLAGAADMLDREVTELAAIATAPPPDPGSRVPDGRPHDWTVDTWRTYLTASGVTTAAFIKEAAVTAHQITATGAPEPAPGSLADLHGRESLAALMHGWVEEQWEQTQ